MKARILQYMICGLMILLQAPAADAQVFSDESLKFSQLLNWIGKYYVDSTDQDKLVETAIIEMLKELDPHSTYLTKKEVKEMTEPLQGNFEGIGVSFNILQDTIFIINPIPGGPSEKVGIRSGDRIIFIEDENVAGVGMTNSGVFSRLKGKKGTKVNISVQRRSEKELIEFTIVRDKIPIHSLDASYMINDKIGYIKLNRFSFTTEEEFRTALTELKKQGLHDLVLDLSGNGGGYLDVAIRLTDQFLDEKKLIVYTMGVHHPKRTYQSTSRGDFKQGRVVVLIDQGSASASEITAGAIQDWDRGVIVGRRSFGKGLVQNPMLLLDSSMVRLTIARYYTPTGRLIQKPYDQGYDAYSRDLINRYNNGELTIEDTAVFPESAKYKTLLYKRTVYGGGGIMPDFFVPIDTSYNTEYFSSLLNKGILNFFVLNYIDENRKSLDARFADFDDFKKNFLITDKLLSKLQDYAAGEKLSLNKEEFDISRIQIELLLKAYIARDLWNTSEFYEIINQTNPSVLKAIEVLESKNDDYQAMLQNRY